MTSQYDFRSPDVLVPAGEGFRFTCQYDNTTDATVGWGERATDEMCILFGLCYSPAGGLPPSEDCVF